MKKLLPVFILALFSYTVHAQTEFFVFKKHQKTINTYYKGSYIAFQNQDKQWMAGFITKIHKDSFWVRPTIVVYGMMHIDTLHFPSQVYTFSDVYAMPKTGVQIDYTDGSFQISKTGGHQHWYWIKSGWIFRVIGAGYAFVYTVNGLIQNDFTTAGSQLGIAAGIFAVGVVLKYTYKVTWRIGKKYHFEGL